MSKGGYILVLYWTHRAIAFDLPATTPAATTTLVGVEKQDFTSLFHIYLRAFDYIKQSSSGLKDKRNSKIKIKMYKN